MRSATTSLNDYLCAIDCASLHLVGLVIAIIQNQLGGIMQIQDLNVHLAMMSLHVDRHASIDDERCSGYCARIIGRNEHLSGGNIVRLSQAI
jgi:hypothetical protein